ncbi:MAG TPA: prepilin peptidase [Vicinamibacterales bacterium]|jgi:leader peptidase (prepilin peptidase)/N-methyltransferase
MPVAIAALFGLIIGSFLNVCIYRLPRNLSIVWPASRCTTCNRNLSWYENIPVLSWTVLGGRCRTCGERISVVYPIVEIATAVVFALTYAAFGATPLFAVRLLFGCAMIVLFVIDLQHQILPNEITLPGIVVGLAASTFVEPGLAEAVIGAVAGGGALWLVAWGYERLRHRQGMGFGDVKMLAMIGAFLGWKLMLLTLMAASLTGSLVAVALLLAGRADSQSRLPLGTFLALAAVPVCLRGQAIIDWYVTLYR